jgi:hypothetical protein
VIHALAHHSRPVATVFLYENSEGRRLAATGAWGGEVRVIDPISGELIARPAIPYTNAVRSITTMRGEQSHTLVVGRNDSRLSIVDATTLEVLETTPEVEGESAGEIMCMATFDGQASSLPGLALVACTMKGYIMIWHPQRGMVARVKGHENGSIRGLGMYIDFHGKNIAVTGSVW